jgi:hypothetical protein
MCRNLTLEATGPLERKVDISGPALQSLRQELSTIKQQKTTDKTTEIMSNQVLMNPTRQKDG